MHKKIKDQASANRMEQMERKIASDMADILEWDTVHFEKCYDIAVEVYRADRGVFDYGVYLACREIDKLKPWDRKVADLIRIEMMDQYEESKGSE